MALNDIKVLQEQSNGSLKETLLTPSVIGAAATSHTHATTDVTNFNTAAAAAAPVQSVNGSTGAVTIAIPAASSTTPAALGTAAVGTGTTFARADHVHALPNSPFVISATSSSGTAGGSSQTVGPFISYFNGTGGSGYSNSASNRQRTMHQACVIKKVCVTLASSNATTVSDGVVSFYNNTTTTDYTLFSGVVADTTGNFVVHDATALSIPVAAGDKFSFKISWPNTNPANVRAMVDIYCYPV